MQAFGELSGVLGSLGPPLRGCPLLPRTGLHGQGAFGFNVSSTGDEPQQGWAPCGVSSAANSRYREPWWVWPKPGLWAGISASGSVSRKARLPDGVKETGLVLAWEEVAAQHRMRNWGCFWKHPRSPSISIWLLSETPCFHLFVTIFNIFTTNSWSLVSAKCVIFRMCCTDAVLSKIDSSPFSLFFGT